MLKQSIIFNIGEETRPVIEQIKETKVPKSIFIEQYKKAFLEIDRYIGQVKETKEDPNSFHKQNEEINNIFAFIGERGSGKTSCMLSVAIALIDNPGTKIKNDELFGELKDLKSKKYHKIDLIDPSFFVYKNNILSIVIAKLLRNFMNHLRSVMKIIVMVNVAN